MKSLSELLAMDGYAGFVWPAYLIVAAVLAGLRIASRRSLKSAEGALRALEAPEEGS